MCRHVLPNAMVATLTFLPFITSGAVVTLTALDFLGFGLPPGSPSLGELLKQGKNNLQAPWLGFTGFFVIALMLTLLVFIGEAVRDAFDPRKALAPRRAPRAGARRASVRAGGRGRRPAGGRRTARRDSDDAAARGRRPARPLRRGADAVEAVRGVSLRPRSRRDAGAGRRERLGQVGDRALDPAAPALSARQRTRAAASASRAGAGRRRRRDAARASAATASR